MTKTQKPKALVTVAKQLTIAEKTAEKIVDVVNRFNLKKVPKDTTISTVELRIQEAINEAVEETVKEICLRFDSIINAHLWGDYSFNGREVLNDANKYLNELHNWMEN